MVNSALTHPYGTNDDIVSFLSTIYMGMETAVVILGFIAAILVHKYKMFGKFPGCFFKWLLYLDVFAAMYAGPIRWAEGPVRPVMGAPTTETGCYLVAMGDTFFHIATLVINTFVVACIFYMIYFQNAKFSNNSKNWILSLVGILSVATAFSLTALAGPVSTWIGWCTMDSVGVVLKLLITCLFLSLQITLIVPTVMVITSASAKSQSTTSTVMFMSFIGIVVCQMIGVVPMIVMEYMSYARLNIPIYMKYVVLAGTSIARIINTLLVTYKVAVKAFPKLTARQNSRKSSRRFTRTGTGGKSSNSKSDSSSSRSSRTGFSTAGEPGAKGAEPESLRLPGDRDYYQWIAAENAAATAAANQGVSKTDEKKKKALEEDKGLCAKIPIKYLLLTVIAIPVLLQGSAIAFVLEKKTSLKDHSEIAQLNIQLTKKLSNLIHESQKERGRTGGFVGSGGTRFAPELDAQRKLLDGRVSELQVFLDKTYNVGRIMTNNEFASGLGQMYLLDVHRAHVSAMDFGSADALAFYTNLNTKFLHTIATVCEYMAEGTVDPYIYSTLAFLTAEEKMGHERGSGAGAFASGGWDNTGLMKFIGIISSQDASREIFKGFATKEALKMFAEIEAGELAKICSDMRAISLRNVPEEMAATNAPYWFEQMTSYIDQMWAIEESESRKGAALASEQLDHDISVVVDILLITCGSLVLCGLTGLIVSQAIVGLRKSHKHSSKHKKNKCAWFDHEVHLGFHSLWCIVVLFSVMAVMVNEESQHLRASSMMTNNFDLRERFAAVIYESQKERGSAALYMGSMGTKFEKELKEQMERATEAIEEFSQYMKSGKYMLQYVLDSKPFNALIPRINEGLAVHRDNVLNLKISKGEGIAYYTQYIKDMLDVIALFTTDKSVAYGHADNNRMFSYLATMLAKETMGIERAVGSVATEQGKFPNEGMWQKFVTLATGREAYLEYFKAFATPTVKKQLADSYESQHSKLIMKWEGLMLAKDFETEKIDSGLWFNNMTLKINDVRNVELAAVEEIVIHLDELIDEASTLQVALSFLMTLSLISGIIVFVRIEYMLVEAKKLQLVAATPSMNSKVKAEMEEYAYDKCVKCKTGLYCPRCHDKEFEMFQEMAALTAKRSAVEDKIAEQRARLTAARKIEVEEQEKKKAAARKRAAEEREALLAAQKAGHDV